MHKHVASTFLCCTHVQVGLAFDVQLKVAMCNMGEPLQEHDVLAMMKVCCLALGVGVNE